MQKRIWQKLAEVNEVEPKTTCIDQIVKDHPNLVGRTIKNLLKLALMVSADRKCTIDAALISEMMIFNPTVDDVFAQD